VQAFDLDPQAAVAGRVSRIGTLRDSVLEREFAYDMISALAGIEEEMLQSGLGNVPKRTNGTPAKRPRSASPLTRSGIFQ
jgi:hypothetical protein